jgi:hypothetical protein
MTQDTWLGLHGDAFVGLKMSTKSEDTSHATGEALGAQPHRYLHPRVRFWST